MINVSSMGGWARGHSWGLILLIIYRRLVVVISNISIRVGLLKIGSSTVLAWMGKGVKLVIIIVWGQGGSREGHVLVYGLGGGAL